MDHADSPAPCASARQVTVYTVTYNMHGRAPPETVDAFLPSTGFDIYAIGTQECERGIGTSIVYSGKPRWEKKLMETLGSTHTALRMHSLGAMHLAVFVKNELTPFISCIQSSDVPTGVGNVVGNKGGIGVSFLLGSTSFLFITSHLTAHHKNLQARNDDFRRIYNNIQLRPVPAVRRTTQASEPSRSSKETLSVPIQETGGAVSAIQPNTPAPEQFDRVFWFGDLNYRLCGNVSIVEALIRQFDTMAEVLVSNDQLTQEMKKGNVFQGFTEGPLRFKPTYKFVLDTNEYALAPPKGRIPSWTDRVLWKTCEDIRLLRYSSAMEFTYSDHRPVFAEFECRWRISLERSAGSQNSSRSCIIF